jgi:hypothetical protein
MVSVARPRPRGRAYHSSFPIPFQVSDLAIDAMLDTSAAQQGQLKAENLAIVSSTMTRRDLSRRNRLHVRLGGSAQAQSFRETDADRAAVTSQ